MGPQVQPKCSWHPKHVRNNWELRKQGYLIRFGHSEALLLKKRTLNGYFSRPAQTDPYAGKHPHNKNSERMSNCHFRNSLWQNCTTPPFGISLGWTSIILGCIPKHRKKFGMDPKLRPAQFLTVHPSRFFWHIPHSEPNWKTCVYLKSSINQSGCVESESSFLCTL